MQDLAQHGQGLKGLSFYLGGSFILFCLSIVKSIKKHVHAIN